MFSQQITVSIPEIPVGEFLRFGLTERFPTSVRDALPTQFCAPAVDSGERGGRNARGRAGSSWVLGGVERHRGRSAIRCRRGQRRRTDAGRHGRR